MENKVRLVEINSLEGWNTREVLFEKDGIVAYLEPNEKGFYIASEGQWREIVVKQKKGYYTDAFSKIHFVENADLNRISNLNLFLKQEQAEASLALAQLSFLIHEHNNGFVTDDNCKARIVKRRNHFDIENTSTSCFLSFKSKTLAQDFLMTHIELLREASPLL